MQKRSIQWVNTVAYCRIIHTLGWNIVYQGDSNMMQKTLLLNGEWTIFYNPDQPSGFSILLLGGETQYVNEKTSDWMEHPGKQKIVKHMLSKGYTLFSSNLGGAHWGNNHAAELAAELYAFFIRQEIVNEKIHIIAEGTGALLLNELVELLNGKIRSILLLNPVLSLSDRVEEEKYKKFFYKKILKEIAKANDLTDHLVPEWIQTKEDVFIPEKIPVLIIHVLDRLEENISGLYDDFIAVHGTTEIKYVTPEKRYIVPYQISTFFKKNEKIL